MISSIWQRYHPATQKRGAIESELLLHNPKYKLEIKK